MKKLLFALICLICCSCKWFDSLLEEYDSEPYVGFEIYNDSEEVISTCWSYFINGEIRFSEAYGYSYAPLEDMMDTSLAKPKYWTILKIDPKKTRQLYVGKRSFQYLKGSAWDSVCVYVASKGENIQEWVISRNDSLLLKRYTYTVDDLQNYPQWVPIKYGDKLD